MSIRIPTILVFLLLQACNSISTNCESPEFKAYSAALEVSVGARFADEYFTAWRTPLDSCEERSQRALFIDSFFEGYRARNTIYGPPSTFLRVTKAGLLAGEKYRRANPNSAVATYASFGYTAISTEGVWSTGFEHSGFVPIEGYEGETWWAEVLPELGRKYPQGFLPKEAVRTRIKGYVSGKGQHGHLGAYERKVYVDDVTILGPAQQTAAADRREDAAPAER